MALIDDSLISDPRKQKWVDEISKILTHQLTIPFELIPKPSVFQVPEKLAAEKPEAYEPQHIGLGPNHHFRPQPYKRMEQKKLTVVQSVLQDRQINDFKVVIEKIRKLVPLVRACYDMSLQDDDDTLAWVFAIDGVFLLEVIRKYNTDGIFHFPSMQDILMMENQLPFEALKEMDEALMQPSSGTSTTLHDTFSPTIFRAFSLSHSSLDLCAISVAPTNAKHLLDYMYQSIIKKASLPLEPKMETQVIDIRPTNHMADVIIKVSDCINQIPKDEIVQIYERTITTLETFSQSKTPIPSASEYHKRAGIRFCNLNIDQGIKNIYIDGEKFVLPSLTLNNDVEVVLRNLVAYEMLVTKSDEFPLTEYVSLMCGLIKNTNDAKLLRNEDIVRSDLDDDEVVKLFSGMSSSILISMEKKKKEKSKLTRMIEEANKAYERRPSMKANFLMKKLASWLLLILKATGGFVERSWKIVAFIISIGTVILLTLKAYCDTYGCEKTNDTLLSYVSRSLITA